MKQFHEQDVKKSLIIFTDGSSLGNPGPGGYGAVVAYPLLDEVIELGGNKLFTTNNEMELTAVITALAYSFSNTAPTSIFTDSSYVISGITQWIHGWIKNNWKTSTQQEVANKALWQQLYQLVTEREVYTTITWHHVPGHVGIAGNERCDVLATSYAHGKPESLYRGKLSSYTYPILDISFPEENLIQKKEKKSSSQAKAYSYLSLVDRHVMRHATWESCKARVHGKKAQFKKAFSSEDEDIICTAWGVTPPREGIYDQ